VFEFDLKRADGYFEAGEYVVALSGPDGEVGNNQRITLKGDNPPVYRGAMDFSDTKSNKQKGPKLQKVSSGLDGGSDEVAQNDSPAAATPVGGNVEAVGQAPDMIPKSSYDKTSEEEAVHERSCGCRVAGLERGSAAGGSAAVFGAALVLARRRRRRSER